MSCNIHCEASEMKLNFIYQTMNSNVLMHSITMMNIMLNILGQKQNLVNISIADLWHLSFQLIDDLPFQDLLPDIWMSHIHYHSLWCTCICHADSNQMNILMCFTTLQLIESGTDK